jgi:signal transduction histidine kinase
VRAADPAETLARFSRLIAESDAKEQILPLLLEAATGHVGADASCVLEVSHDGGLEVSYSKDLPPELLARCASETMVLGSELELALNEAAAGLYSQVNLLPLVSASDLFGALVLFFRGSERPGEEHVRVLAGLCDLAAISLRKVHQIETLRRSLAELKASREALARSEKLRALGQMAAGVSHDLVNILNPLTIEVQLLKRRLGKADRPVDREAALEVLGRMDHVIQHGMETIRRLRDFGRQAPEGVTEVVALDAMAKEAIALVNPRLGAGRGVSLIEELGHPPVIAVERAELVAALLNLLVNSLDAMPAGGTLTVRSGAGDGLSWVEVTDTGCGIPPEVEQRMFEPFFTTKGSEGTGLGLAMVYAFVQRHAGKLTVRTAPGAGTTIRLAFPGVPAG